MVQTDIKSRMVVSIYGNGESGVPNKSLSHASQIHSCRIRIPSTDSDVFPRSSVAMDPSFGDGGCRMEYRTPIQ